MFVSEVRLWWGWIGFNCGSSFGITKSKWLVATRAGVATINSTAGGGLAALLYTKGKSKGKLVLPHEVANGLLGTFGWFVWNSSTGLLDFLLWKHRIYL